MELLPSSHCFAQDGSDAVLRSRLTDMGVQFSDDNSVELLMSGKKKFERMFSDIREARQSIHLEYFNFRNDSIASLLFDLLREKRREGVEVRALFDGFGNDSNNQPLLKHHLRSLRADSINIYEYDPIRFPWVNHIWPRDHRKIVVIDGRIAYTGGMNVADYYITGTEQVGEWRDMHCRIEGSAVNQLQHIFLRMWNKVTGEDIIQQPRYYRGGTTGSGRSVIGIVNREPGAVYDSKGHLLGSSDAMRRFYVAAIDAARDSLKIVNPYFTLTSSINHALERALGRGVQVDIMVSAKSDVPLTPDCVYYNAHRLMKRGARVWVYEPGFHHSKIMMVDGSYCTVGSANLDARGMRFDYEENAVIIDAATTATLDSMFYADIRKSFLLTPQTWNKMRTPWQKSRGWLAHLLRPLL
ncbi:MAG: phosphatidylserine/phosphatidylglycerophosphate/cardiolipin synthase family protein [Prevotella sp.]|nr:phosphatidylserine/phosphatidylglycerophosphate/cardiolipin synthase family protein [Prevotella sp.]